MHHTCFAQLYAWKNIYHSASNHLMAYIVLLILIEGLEEMDRMEQAFTLVVLSSVSAFFLKKNNYDDS